MNLQFLRSLASGRGLAVSPRERLLPAPPRRSPRAPRSPLTFGRRDEVLPVLDELFDELVGPLELHFVGADPLPEPRTVEVAVAEFQGLQPHDCSGPREPPANEPPARPRRATARARPGAAARCGAARAGSPGEASSLGRVASPARTCPWEPSLDARTIGRPTPGGPAEAQVPAAPPRAAPAPNTLPEARGCPAPGASPARPARPLVFPPPSFFLSSTPFPSFPRTPLPSLPHAQLPLLFLPRLPGSVCPAALLHPRGACLSPFLLLPFSG